MISLIFLLIMILVKQGQSHVGYCQESRCGEAGPPIRFPYRIKDRQPGHCGYGASFDLSCTDTNHTSLVLPNSVTVYVKSIDYAHKTVSVSHPDNCFPRQARNISLSGSPFRFNSKIIEDFILFNCSTSRKIESYYYDTSPCLGVPGYEVHIYDRNQEIRISEHRELLDCTKMYSVLSFPYEMFSSRHTNHLQLKWSEPACGKCEAQGRRCIKLITVNFKFKCIPIKFFITGVTSFLLVLLLAAVLFSLRFNKKEKENEARIVKFLEDYEALTPTRYSYSDLKKITNQFKDMLGQGANGKVFKGKLSNEILVAVKILNNSTGNGEEFINEVATMGTIHHVNVVRLVGFCAEGFHRALVYEFLPNESLEKFIFSDDGNNSRSFLGWQKLQDIALGIAKGIEYLHQGCDQRILHFDIKPHNILLDENFTPKISDFGLAKLCSKDQSVISMTTARGTMGYIAPEVFSRNFGKVSYKSDVYSFGRLLLEMAEGRENRNNNVEQSNQMFYSQWIYDHLERGKELRNLTVEEGDAKIARKLAIIALRCIQWCPMDRPSMTSVVQMLEGDGNDLATPPNPFAPSSHRKMCAGGPAVTPILQELAVISE